jgi:hypothetical protein
MGDPLRDQRGLDHRNEAQENERGEGGQRHHADPGQKLADVLARPSRRTGGDQSARRQRKSKHQGDGHEDFGQDHSHSRLSELLPGWGKAGEDPHGQYQGPGGHHEVDQSGADNQLQPHHEGSEDEEQSTESTDELQVGDERGPVVSKRRQGIRRCEPHDLISRLVCCRHQCGSETDQRQGTDAGDGQVH